MSPSNNVPSSPDHAVAGAGHDDVLPVPVVVLGLRHAQDLDTGGGGPRGRDTGVHTGQRVTIHVPQIQPGPSTRHDVARQLVDADRRHRPHVAREVLDVSPPGEIPDDGRPVPGAGDSDA